MRVRRGNHPNHERGQTGGMAHLTAGVCRQDAAHPLPWSRAQPQNISAGQGFFTVLNGKYCPTQCPPPTVSAIAALQQSWPGRGRVTSTSANIKNCILGPMTFDTPSADGRPPASINPAPTATIDRPLSTAKRRHKAKKTVLLLLLREEGGHKHLPLNRHPESDRGPQSVVDDWTWQGLTHNEQQ